MRPHARQLASVLLLALPLGAPSAAAQDAPRPLDHDDYARWQRITDDALSRDGRWLTFVLQPGDGDPTLVVRSVDGEATARVERADDPVLTGDGTFLVALLKPAQSVVDSLRRADTDDDDLPKDSLVVIDLSAVTAAGGGSSGWRVARVESFLVPERGDVVAYRLVEEPPADSARDEEEEEEEAEAEGRERRGGGEDDEDEPPRTDAGTTLVLRRLDDGVEHRFPHATDYRFTDDGRYLFYAASSPEGEADGAYRVDTSTGAATALLEGEGRYLGLAVQKDGHRAAFLSDRDDRAADEPAFALYAADAEEVARRLAGPGSAGIPPRWWIGEFGEPSLSASGERVFFGTTARPAPDGDEPDPLPDDEVEVDVWNWRDPYLQPMQLARLEEERERTYRAWVPFDGGPVIQLETPELESVRVGADGDASLALGLTDGPYRPLLSWDGRYVDAWVVDVATGERRLAQERIRGSAALSPGERWITWWDGESKAWWAMPAGGGDAVSLTRGVPQPVHEVLDDHPEPPPPYGLAGWTEGDGHVLVYDEHDVWAIDPTEAAEPVNLTEGVGRRDGLRFRYLSLDPELETIPTGEPVLLSAFHVTTRQEGFYRDRFDGAGPPERLVLEDAAFSEPRKADQADRLLFTRETFRDFPDLWVSQPDLGDRRKLTAVNADLRTGVRWGSAELVEWTSNDGIPLQGILYKPDDFDPSVRHPMMVYFYERMSDGLHRHHVPAPGSSSINFTFYVSRGYVVFVPDIPYEIGHPGESALDAVVPGVLSLVARGFVDPARIGVQGHSWGGYQIAWMITRTDVFAAAEAGAPVANMTSAYGGIRWGTGMSRMFQYERTQSRIGGSLWERPLLYLENSPLFAADKIRTPLLMMHNDGDTAVPWYQGIEMFVALRRLGRPVWMLNYNGEPHGLQREANRKDWAVRMQQFFDHYLMDAPSPVWMEEGVPAILKGETLGLELVPEKAAAGGGGSR
jgi:dipeptidyl aminopeptidase/acylaminoacyl peptidase